MAVTLLIPGLGPDWVKCGTVDIPRKVKSMPATQGKQVAEKQSISSERSANAEAAWDVNELMERLDGDRVFLCELLQVFREDSQVNLEKAKSSLSNGDLPGLMSAAHTLKGMLKNLSMNRAGEIAYGLETASKQGRSDEAAKLFAELENAVAEVVPLVDAQLAEAQA
jgi:HPt (histidine-containing phosphotransfer) domain-containing protein